MRHAGIVALGMALLVGGRAAAAPGGAPVEYFAALPQHAQVTLSPGGRHVAAKIALDGRNGLVIYDLDNPERPPFVMPAGDAEMAWLEWASDSRLLVSLEYALRRGFTATKETRLLAISADGSNPLHLVRPRRRDEPLVQFGDRVVDLLIGDPDHILMSFNPEDVARPRLWRINIHNGRRQLVAGGSEALGRWFVDQQARPRLSIGTDGKTRRVLHRPPGGKGWETMLEYPLGSGPMFSPVLFDHDDPDLLYVISNHDGDTAGLYGYRLSERAFVATLFVHPERDVDRIYRSPDGRSIAGVSFADDEDHIHWFDPRHAGILARAQALLPDRQPYITSTSRDLSRIVLLAGGPSLPDRYYVYSPDSGRLLYLAPTWPELESLPMGDLLPVSYAARDGLEIPGYLTLPPGLEGLPEAPLPAIVLPHGGPHARDAAGFDPLVQLLAQRGYAVLQMNFRGSTGYGTEFRAAGYRQWGQAMQDDVTDGTRWLIAQGIADPERICIVGGSYGGYAALIGAAKEPDLYACAVSLNGLSDLPRFLAHLHQYRDGRVLGRPIGDSWRDRHQLAENSPVNRVSDIRAPVLLVHGGKDRVVPPVQSRVMARALRRAGKDHEFIELEDGDHYLRRGEHRLAFFSALDRFLAQHLAPQAQVAGPAP